MAKLVTLLIVLSGLGLFVLLVGKLIMLLLSYLDARTERAIDKLDKKHENRGE